MIRKMTVAAMMVLVGCIDQPVRNLPSNSAALDPSIRAAGPRMRVAQREAIDRAQILPAVATTAPRCVQDHAQCESGGTACCDGFCSDELGTYSAGVCYLPLELDAFCMRDGHCNSGSCQDNRCVNACGGEGASCYGADHPCCGGFFCSIDPNTYGQGHCMPAQPPQAFCAGGEECASGNCTNNICD